MEVEKGVTFSVSRDSVKYPHEEWKSFQETHCLWVQEVQRPDGVLFSLPPSEVDGALRLFRWDAKCELAERELAALCDRHRAIGVVDEGFVDYPWLRPPLPMPQVDLLESMDLNWPQEVMDAVCNLKEPTNSLNARMRSSLGRLISMPRFGTEADALRVAWLQLPDQSRPPLPIRRSARSSKLPVKMEWSSADPSELRDFVSEFDHFCDGWQIAGMATWHLPIPSELNLVPGLGSQTGETRGALGFRVPLHFPLQAEDGVGSQVLETHQRLATEVGIEDLGSWQSYATMFEIHHWEYVLRHRYCREIQKRAFVQNVEFFLAELLGISRERVRVLRTRLRAKLRSK